MMKVIRALSTVLLHTSETELASSTDSTQETDPDQAAELDIFTTVWSELDYTTDAFVTTDVRQFYVCDRGALCTCGGAGFGVQVYMKRTLSTCGLPVQFGR